MSNFPRCRRTSGPSSAKGKAIRVERERTHNMGVGASCRKGGMNLARHGRSTGDAVCCLNPAGVLPGLCGPLARVNKLPLGAAWAKCELWGAYSFLRPFFSFLPSLSFLDAFLSLCLACCFSFFFSLDFSFFLSFLFFLPFSVKGS